MEKLLKEFGFSSQEAKTYQSLLKSGGATVSELAKSTKIKRTSCHEYLNSLLEKGFVNLSKIGNKFFYQAQDPDKFRQMINERLFLVDRLVGQIQDLQKGKKEIEISSLSEKEGLKIINKAKKDGKVSLFGEKNKQGYIFNDIVLLFSQNKDLPVVQIKSKEIVDFHKKIKC